MHDPAATWVGGACHAPAVQAPLTNRTLLTTSRSLGYSASIARERKAEAEEERSGERSANKNQKKNKKTKRKKQGSNKSVQRGYKMEAKNEISVFKLHHHKVVKRSEIPPQKSLKHVS